MAQPTPAPIRICPGCDGFASVAITLGGRDRNGNRRTITAHCRTCHGTGTGTTPTHPARHRGHRRLHPPLTPPPGHRAPFRPGVPASAF
nr:hypothetical protein OG781_16465 [Streptomyces sp. NBC_00830]